MVHRRGGTLTMLAVSDPPGLDPTQLQNAGPADAVPAAAVFDTLLYTDYSSSALIPQTAESLTSADALTWTLKLRPGITFTDGTPYDANAVRFNYLRLQDPNNRAVRAAEANLI